MSAFIVSNKAMNNVVEGVRRYKQAYQDTQSVEDLTKLGQKFFDLNTLAVNGRYTEQEAAPGFVYTTDLGSKISDEQIWKSMSSLNYQCSEAPAIYDPAFQELKDLQLAFAGYFFSKSPKYDAADWS